MALFFANVQTQPKIHMEFQGIPNSQNNLEKVEAPILPDLKTYYKAAIIKTLTKG